jgi:hypothetical protein
MNKFSFLSVSWLLAMSLLVSSCSAVEGIFNAGMSFGIFIVVAIIVVIGFLVLKARK